MRTNAVKQKLDAGEVVIGTMIDEVRSPAIAQILAVAGFDFFFIDMEHGAYDLPTASDIMKAARLAGIVPLVRVPDFRHFPKGRIMDSGALGLMVPRVETREQVEEMVAEIKYPPLGRRGAFVSGANNDYCPQPLAAFIEEANRETLVIVQIELAVIQLASHRHPEHPRELDEVREAHLPVPVEVWAGIRTGSILSGDIVLFAYSVISPRVAYSQ